MWAWSVCNRAVNARCVFSNLHKPRTTLPRTQLSHYSKSVGRKPHGFHFLFWQRVSWPIVFPPFKTITSLAVLISVCFCDGVVVPSFGGQSGFNGTEAAAGNEIRLLTFTGCIYTSAARGVQCTDGQCGEKTREKSKNKRWPAVARVPGEASHHYPVPPHTPVSAAPITYYSLRICCFHNRKPIIWITRSGHRD